MISACRVQCLPVVLPQCGKLIQRVQRFNGCGRFCPSWDSPPWVCCGLVCVVQILAAFAYFVFSCLCFAVSRLPPPPVRPVPLRIIPVCKFRRSTTAAPLPAAGLPPLGQIHLLFFLFFIKKHFARCASSCLLLVRFCCAACRLCTWSAVRIASISFSCGCVVGVKTLCCRAPLQSLPCHRRDKIYCALRQSLPARSCPVCQNDF